MVIAGLNFGNICHIYFRETCMGYFSKQLKGYGILTSPLPGPPLCIETKINFVNQNKGKVTQKIFPRGRISLAMS